MIPRTRPNFGIFTLLASLRHGRQRGEKSKALEEAIAQRLGGGRAVLAPSGRGALFLLLHCLPPGRVCVPGYTCSAVAEAAILAGREVCFLEHKAGEINLTVGDIESQLKPGDIFILTHQYGYATDVRAIVDCAERQGAVVIEDIAAAFGGTSTGQPLGSFGHAAFGSFDVSKLVHVPLKGGFVRTGDATLASLLVDRGASLQRQMSIPRMLEILLKACLLCVLTTQPLYRFFHMVNFGLRRRTTAEDSKLAEVPNAYYLDRFTEWQASVALPQLHGLNDIVDRRAHVHDVLRENCKAHPLFEIEQTPPEVPGATVRFPIYARGDKLSLYRTLTRNGVDCGFSFTALATQRIQSSAWDIADSVLNLPYYPTLTDRELATMTRALGRIRRTPHHAG